MPDNDEGLIDELQAQLEDTNKVEFIFETDENLKAGNYAAELTDVKFEDGVIKVELRILMSC